MITRAFLTGMTVVVLALSGCAENEHPGNDRGADRAKDKPVADVVSAEEAVRLADVSSTYPQTMPEEEYAKVVSGPTCRFSYTRVGDPVLVVETSGADTSQSPAVMKLHGKLFKLQAKRSTGTTRANGEGIAAAVTPDGEGEELRNAELRFRIQGAGEIGYWGYYACS
ncbi:MULTISPECIES: DUF6692 family protein [Methyloceanibacter]|nr:MULTISPECIES: DUF6692 family protein [Methyloceanibacter]